MQVSPTPTSEIYVGVGGNIHVLPTPTSYIYAGVGRECAGFTYAPTS